MDMKLAVLVRKCVFDFDVICKEMRVLMEQGDLGDQAMRNAPLMDSEACRKRWTQLDAAQWAQVDPTNTKFEPVYKVCIASAILGNGHGAQPSFQTLSALAAGSMPSYLTIPTKFPSVSDMNDEDEDEGDGDDDVEGEEKVSSVEDKTRSFRQRIALGVDASVSVGEGVEEAKGSDSVSSSSHVTSSTMTLAADLD